MVDLYGREMRVPASQVSDYLLSLGEQNRGLCVHMVIHGRVPRPSQWGYRRERHRSMH